LQTAANDSVYLIGWPPVIAAHIMLVLAVLGVWRHIKTLPKQ